MFFYEANEIPRKFLLVRPCSRENSFATTQLDAFQCAVVVFSTVLCRCSRRHRPHSLRSLIITFISIYDCLQMFL